MEFGVSAEIWRPFPVLNAPPHCTAFVRWDALDESHAEKLHGQSLERLAQRGGLDPVEIYWNLHKLPFGTEVEPVAALIQANFIADMPAQSPQPRANQ